jgi:hypothetical protein
VLLRVVGYPLALEAANVLKHEKVGRQIFYKIKRANLVRARKWLEQFDKE